MENVVITWQTMLALLGGLAIIMSFAKEIKELKKPSENLRKTVENQGEMLERDNKRLNALESANALMLRSQLQIMNHMIDGNHQAQLIQARDDMQAELAKIKII
jgi:hypothetical protein